MSDENSYAKIRGITDIHRYIEKVSCLKNSIIILAVKDTLGCELNGEVAAEWRKLGIRKDLSNKHWRGYLYIRNGTKRAVEMMGEPDQSVAYSGKIDGHAIQIKSAPWNDGNAAEIIIDGKDYAVNQRGINIVIYDKKYHAIADAVCFDTHRKDFVCTRLADIHIRKRLALKNILPDKVEVRIFSRGKCIYGTRTDPWRKRFVFLPLVEYILVDRGDLSTDIGIMNIPRYQKYIVGKAQYHDVKVFLATQVLKNMELRPIPTIGEIEALYEIYKSGVCGVQMSEETAVGKYVREMAAVLNDM